MLSQAAPGAKKSPTELQCKLFGCSVLDDIKSQWFFLLSHRPSPYIHAAYHPHTGNTVCAQTSNKTFISALVSFQKNLFLPSFAISSFTLITLAILVNQDNFSKGYLLITTRFIHTKHGDNQKAAWVNIYKSFTKMKQDSNDE